MPSRSSTRSRRKTTSRSSAVSLRRCLRRRLRAYVVSSGTYGPMTYAPSQATSAPGTRRWCYRCSRCFTTPWTSISTSAIGTPRRSRRGDSSVVSARLVRSIPAPRSRRFESGAPARAAADEPTRVSPAQVRHDHGMDVWRRLARRSGLPQIRPSHRRLGHLGRKGLCGNQPVVREVEYARIEVGLNIRRWRP